MQNLLSYMFQTFVFNCESQASQQLKQQLIRLQPISLLKMSKKLLKQQFNIIALLLAKNIITYSPSAIQIALSISDLFLYQRIAKFQQFSKQYLQKNVGLLVQEFFKNGLQNGFSFPVSYDPIKLKNFKLQNKEEIEQKNIKQQTNSKKKKKIEQQSKSQIVGDKQKYDYAKLIYQYSCPGLSKQQTIQKEEKVVKKDKKNENKIKNGNEKEQQKNKDQLFMINVAEITILLKCSKVIQLINGQVQGKQFQKIKLFEFYYMKNRDELINSKQVQKIEEFIAQLLGPQTLLIFNIIKKFPFITDKQIAKISLQDILTTRTAINKLVQHGFGYFYNQNARTIVYKTFEWQSIVRKYLDSICQCICNLYILIQKLGLIHNAKSKQKILALECEINKLDDVLLLFGY